MNRFRKVAVLGLLIGAALGLMFLPNGPAERRIYAQQVGAAQVPGFFASGTNAVTNAAIGSGGAVTNPASNFLLLVQGSSIYFNGSVQTIGQSTLQLSASNTYLVVWNGISEQVYAKVGVTGPGSPAGQPGVPATILAAIPGVEIPLATVVCNATACGNGGNGSITDARPVSAFPGAGIPLNTTLQANLPSTNVTNGTLIFCTDCTTASACTGAGTGALAVRQNNAWKCF